MSILFFRTLLINLARRLKKYLLFKYLRFIYYI